jgi:hypothetical protein
MILVQIWYLPFSIPSTAIGKSSEGTGGDAATRSNATRLGPERIRVKDPDGSSLLTLNPPSQPTHQKQRLDLWLGHLRGALLGKWRGYMS